MTKWSGEGVQSGEGGAPGPPCFSQRIPFFFFNIAELISDLVLISGVQQSDSVIHIYFFRLFSIRGYSKILNIIPCALQ